MNVYLTMETAGRQSAGATRKAATQISAGACMPDGMRSLSRKPLSVARAIVAACPAPVRHGVVMDGGSVADDRQDLAGHRIGVGREHERAEGVLQRRRVALLAQRRRPGGRGRACLAPEHALRPY